MRLVTLFALLAALTIVPAAAARVDSVATAATSERNFVAFLLPVAGGPENGFGWLLFRQPQDAVKVVFLDVWLVNLAPNHSYYFQRATDSPVDDNCTGTNWLTLGQGPVPQAITTDDSGSGRASLWRDLTAFPEGARFDIHFRVIDAETSAVVLASPCYQFTLTA